MFGTAMLSIMPMIFDLLITGFIFVGIISFICFWFIIHYIGKLEEKDNIDEKPSIISSIAFGVVIVVVIQWVCAVLVRGFIFVGIISFICLWFIIHYIGKLEEKDNIDKKSSIISSIAFGVVMLVVMSWGLSSASRGPTLLGVIPFTYLWFIRRYIGKLEKKDNIDKKTRIIGSICIMVILTMGVVFFLYDPDFVFLKRSRFF